MSKNPSQLAVGAFGEIVLKPKTKLCETVEKSVGLPAHWSYAMHGCALFAAIGLGALAATASQGACSKPEAPSCALERIPFASDKLADDCRKDMVKFRTAMDSYASCLGETSAEQEKAARDEYENVRIRFNQRARGEFD